MHTKANRSSSELTQIYAVAPKKVHMAPFFKHFTFSFSFAFFLTICMCLFSILGTRGILLSRVNCWDWPGVCTMENVTQFPTIKIYKKGEQPITYNGMLGTEELTSFIML